MMRTVALLVVFALAAVPALAQGFTEDFEGGIPATWTVIDNEMTGVAWDTNVFWGDDNWTGGGGMCADVNSDTFGTAEFDTELITHSFVVPGGAMLEYVTNYANFAAYDFADVDIDAGAGWVNLLSWNEDHGGFKALPGEFVSLDLSAYAGQTAQVRFHYYDPNTGDYDWYWEVDDVTVTPEPASLGLLSIGALALLRRR
ncbi:MAG: choice-of-anchor J domain-containing protein [Planctomycetes bacterium]|nr:choice-of-anchor J domain-containing protein [Planctomycetota bacterium]